MATKQVVPSRDALRVLRRLAGYSSATTAASLHNLEPHSAVQKTSRCIHSFSSRRSIALSTKSNSGSDAKLDAIRITGEHFHVHNREQSSAATAQVSGNEHDLFAPFKSPSTIWPTSTTKASEPGNEDHSTSHVVPTKQLDEVEPELGEPQPLIIDLTTPLGGKERLDDIECLPKKSRLVNSRADLEVDPRFHSEIREIERIRYRKNDEAAENSLRSTLTLYASTGRREDWELVKELYSALCLRMAPLVLRRVRDHVVELLLRQSPPRLEAVEILCWRMEADKHQTYKHAASYLTSFGNTHRNLDRQLEETEKVLQGMQRCSVPLDIQVVMPVVRSFIEASQTDAAYDWMRHFQKKYDLQLSARIVAELIRGWGRMMNWSRIDNILLEAHHQGLSRSRPREFAGLVCQALHLFGQYSPDVRIFDYLTYAVRQLGLVPSNYLSREVYSRFVRNKRFDLVQEWTEEQQDAFPGMLSTVRDPLTSQYIAHAWASSHASCTDVLNTCKALAHGSVRDPFSDDLRFLATEVLANDLLSRCRKLAESSGITDFDWDVEKILDTNELFDHVHNLLAAADAKLLIRQRSLQVLEVIRQLDAAQEAVLLLKDIESYMIRYGHNIQVGEQPHSTNKPPSNFIHKATQPMTVSKKWLNLKSIPELHAEVERLYAEQETKDLRNDSSILYEAVFALMNDWRYPDVLALLRRLSGSKRAPNIFDTEVFTAWVTAATNVTGHKDLIEALWAVVDAPSSLKLPARFLVLVRMAQVQLVKLARQKDVQMNKWQSDELEYLKNRIFRRKWYQMGFPEAERIVDPHLRSWREAQNQQRGKADVRLG